MPSVQKFFEKATSNVRSSYVPVGKNKIESRFLERSMYINDLKNKKRFVLITEQNNWELNYKKITFVR